MDLGSHPEVGTNPGHTIRPRKSRARKRVRSFAGGRWLRELVSWSVGDWKGWKVERVITGDFLSN